MPCFLSDSPTWFLWTTGTGGRDLAGGSGQTVPHFGIGSSTRRPGEAYGFNGTPSTLLVSRKASALARCEGAYDPSTILDIERTLSVHLPGFSFKVPEV